MVLFLKTVIHFVLDKTLKDIRGVLLDNRKVFCAPGPSTKHFVRFFNVVQ